MALPDSFIQELLQRNDVESVIGSYVALKRRGRNLVGLCPFHGEKTPSFTVYPETTSFYCFGCGAGGDVITFIKRIENLEYIDAVRFLADRSGLKMPEERHENDAVAKLRLRVLEANREAARIFHQALYRPEGQEALDYFHRRGYTDATIRHFGLGFAPAGWDYLLKAMRAKGFRDNELEAAFLIKKGRNGGYYDIFRNRAIIPIIDIRGNVVGFGGRVLDDSKPKYINTENTLAYNKSRNLFALNFAKNTGRELCICEGFMDVIAMHQAGFTNAVAAQGTAFPDEQIQLIARYADRVNLIFDADGAGQEATKRAIENLRKTGLEVRVVTIPDGKDPDEFIKRNGPEAFKLLLERSSNAVEYSLLKLGESHDLQNPNGKVAYLQEAAKIIAALDSPVERDVYAGRLSQSLGISKEAILQEIRRSDRRQQSTERKRRLPELLRQENKELQQVNPDAAAHPRAASAEENLLGSLLLHPDLIPRAAELLPPEEVVTGFNRTLYTLLTQRHAQGRLVELSFLAEEYDEHGMAYISRMVTQAREHTVTQQELAHFISIIRHEHSLLGMGNPEELDDAELRRMMEALRKKKQGT